MIQRTSNWISLVVTFWFGAAVLTVNANQSSIESDAERARHLLMAVCDSEDSTYIAENSGLSVLSHSAVERNGTPIGWRATLADAENRFELQRLAPRSEFRGARVEWWVGDQPQLALSIDADCRVRIARGMRYDDQGRAFAIAQLDEQLNDLEKDFPLNPPVPPGDIPKGVPVAMVDAGVNYTLDIILDRLARDDEGSIMGFDYWDMDDRPFDANPAQSVFFPQRHGTQTAALLLREAPGAILLPYRYPRPDMSRMGDLVRSAASHGVRIIGIPLGSKNRQDWVTFEQAARDLPDVLFIVSAGNRGVNLDEFPAYPASLALANMLVVTSADDAGAPAPGSNWGPETVDLLIPAEHQTTIDFDGYNKVVSGSSYAVSRVAALAARLLEANPDWTASELKEAIFAAALRSRHADTVSMGYVPDPLWDTASITVSDSRAIDGEPVTSSPRAELSVTLFVMNDSGWEIDLVDAMARETHRILGQCDIEVTRIEVHRLDVPAYLMDFNAAGAHTLISNLPFAANPSVFLVRDTLRQPAFDGEAFGLDNSRSRPWLRNTVWLTAGVDQPELALAHELFHVLTNSGEHVYTWRNLMHPSTRPDGWLLSEQQCQLALEAGIRNGLLSAVN